MYLASHVGRWSTTVIGRFYRGRDHSTVVHSIQRIEAMRETDSNLDVLLCDLKSRICCTDESREELHKPRLITSSLAAEQSDFRILPRDIAAQLRAVLREELRYTQHPDRPGAREE